MDKNILESLVKDGLSQRAISVKLGIGQTTVRYWLVKHGLKTDKKHLCGMCGTTDESAFTSGRYTECRTCRGRYQTSTYRKYKKRAVDYKGGKCEICSYNKCLGGLDFHHKNPAEKDPKWRLMRCWTFERIKKELDKCMLVCRNCHAELHYIDRDDGV